MLAPVTLFVAVEKSPAPRPAILVIAVASEAVLSSADSVMPPSLSLPSLTSVPFTVTLLVNDVLLAAVAPFTAAAATEFVLALFFSSAFDSAAYACAPLVLIVAPLSMVRSAVLFTV